MEINDLMKLLPLLSAVLLPAIGALYGRLRRVEESLLEKANADKVESMMERKFARLESKIDSLSEIVWSRGNGS